MNIFVSKLLRKLYNVYMMNATMVAVFIQPPFFKFLRTLRIKKYERYILVHVIEEHFQKKKEILCITYYMVRKRPYKNER